LGFLSTAVSTVIDLMLARRHFAEVNVSYDCRCLVQFCDDAAAMHKELGFDTPEAMIRDGYGLEPEEVNLALEWIRLNPPDEPVSLQAAKTLALQSYGTNQHTRRGVDNVKSSHKAEMIRPMRLAASPAIIPNLRTVLYPKSCQQTPPRSKQAFAGSQRPSRSPAAKSQNSQPKSATNSMLNDGFTTGPPGVQCDAG
jgi:hypothetical protein